jgi:hypothetical protein
LCSSIFICLCSILSMFSFLFSLFSSLAIIVSVHRNITSEYPHCHLQSFLWSLFAVTRKYEIIVHIALHMSELKIRY